MYSDETEIVVHSNDVDAPVILLVPHTWHLEEKEQHSIERLPAPSPSIPPSSSSSSSSSSSAMMEEEKVDILSTILPSLYSTSFRAKSGDHDSLHQLASSLPANLTHLTVLTPNPADLPILLSHLHHPIVTPIFTTAIGEYCYCLPQSLPSTKGITWKSRSCWCPPPVEEYTAIGVTRRYFSIPAIIPIQPDHLLYTSHCLEEAMDLMKDYEQKLLTKVSRSSQPMVATFLYNRKWMNSSSSLLPDSLIQSHKAVIEGEVSDVLRICPMQLMVDGYIQDRYNDECEEKVDISENEVIMTYGELLKMSIRGYNEGEKVEIPSQGENTTSAECITIFVDEQQYHTPLEFEGENVVTIPVRELRMSFGNTVQKKFPVIVKSIYAF